MPVVRTIPTIGVCHLGSVAIFVAIFFVDMPHLPYPVSGNLAEDRLESHVKSSTMRYAILLAWSEHFFRRLCQICWLHRHTKKLHWLELFGGPIYYWSFSCMTAWSIPRDHYRSTYKPLLVVGGILFVLGEVGNCWCHVRLRSFRSRDYEHSGLVSLQSGKVIPHGGLFSMVSCPQYFCELVVWLGFFMLCFTLVSVLFLFANTVLIVAHSAYKHRRYVEHFDGCSRPVYPRNRKILIPYLF